MKDSETVTVATRVTKPMFEAMIRAHATAHLNIADYMRDLIRRDLEERGIFKEMKP